MSKYVEKIGVRGLLVNGSFLFFVEVVNKLLPFILMPYFVQVLGLEKIGLLALAIAVVQYFKSLSDYGFDLYSTREISENIDNPERVAEIFSTTILIKLGIALCCFLPFFLMVEAVEGFRQEKLVFYSTYFAILLHALTPNWLFQAKEEMKYLAISVFLSRVIYLGLVFSLVSEEKDFVLVPIIELVSLASTAVATLYISFRVYKIPIVLPSYGNYRKRLVEAWSLFVLDFIPNIYSNAGIVVLGVVVGNSAVGVYNVAYKLSAAGVLIIGILRSITYPYLIKNFRYFNSVKFVILSCGLFLSLSLYFWRENLVCIVVGNSVSEIESTLAILSLGPLLISVTAIFGTNYLLIKKRDKVYRNIVFKSSAICFVSAMYFVNTLGVTGAAINLILARFIISLWVYVEYKRSGALEYE